MATALISSSGKLIVTSRAQRAKSHDSKNRTGMKRRFKIIQFCDSKVRFFTEKPSGFPRRQTFLAECLHRKS
jgi:hypothetical protein